MRRALALVVSVVAATGCGDDGSTMGDAGSDGSPDSTVTPSGFVSLTPCPPGWQEVGAADEPTICEPWPAGGHDACDASSAHFPGESGCTLIGTPCPAGDFEEGLADDGSVIFVQPGATGGDGTRGAPMGSVSDALATASDGMTVALSKGMHDGTFTVPSGVTVRGACVAETRLSDSAEAGYAVVTLDGSGSALENVGIDAGSNNGIYGEYLSDARIEDVVITGAGPMGESGGIEHGGATLDVRNVRITNTGYGLIYVLEGAGSYLHVERVAIEDVRWAISGYSLHREADFRLSDAAIRGTEVATVQLVSDLGTSTIERTIIENARYTGIYFLDGGQLTVTDTVIRDMESDPEGLDGAGIAADSANITSTDPGLVLRRVLIDRVRDVGLWVYWTIVDAQAVVVRDVRRQACTDCPSTGGAAGLVADAMGQLDLTDFYVADVDGCGVHVGVDGEIDLDSGDVRRATVGACISSEGYDINRLTSGVRYDDNMSSLDATGLPVPTIDGLGVP